MLFSITSIQAQRSTNSPYSRFGYGLLNEKSLCFGQGLSNTGIALRPSNHISIINPASVSAIDSSHFIFEIGIKNQFTKISVNGQDATTSNSNMEYLAVGFPVTRWWGMGITMLPFSKVGYSFKQSQTLIDNTKIETYYYGIGGSNQLVWANGFQPIKGLSIGINSGIIFGETTFEAYNNLTTDMLSEDALKTNKIDMKGVFFESGIQYELKINKKNSILFGAIFSPNQKLKSKNSLVVKTTVDGQVAVESIEDQSIKSDLPMKIGAGLGFTQKDKVMCGVDYKYQDWTNSNIYGKTSNYFQKMQNVSLGLEYLPNKFASSGYYNRIRYRFGVKYLQSNIALPESQSDTKLYSVNEMSASLGFGLPLKMSANNINVSFEYGNRSTKSKILPKETFFVINLNFTLNENWFYKRKIK